VSDDTDPDATDVTYLGLSKKTVVFEVARAAYAIGISTAVTTLLVFGVYLLGVELPGIIIFTMFLIGLGFLPAGLYFYDRYHRRDLVIADLGHAIVRPVALVYRILRAP
jgi:hypothetical protein